MPILLKKVVTLAEFTEVLWLLATLMCTSALTFQILSIVGIPDCFRRRKPRKRSVGRLQHCQTSSQYQQLRCVCEDQRWRDFNLGHCQVSHFHCYKPQLWNRNYVLLEVHPQQNIFKLAALFHVLSWYEYCNITALLPRMLHNLLFQVQESSTLNWFDSAGSHWNGGQL